MQELAETGARLAAPPVPAAGLVLGHQARGLQGLLDERIAEAHAMLAPGELVEMPDVEPQIPLAIDRKSTRLNSSHTVISYAVFCLKKKKNKDNMIKPSQSHGNQ